MLNFDMQAIITGREAVFHNAIRGWLQAMVFTPRAPKLHFVVRQTLAQILIICILMLSQ